MPTATRAPRATDPTDRRNSPRLLRILVGSGDKVGLSALPVLLVGVPLNLRYPSAFDVGGPPSGLLAASIAVLAAGVTVWLWSVELILCNVPRGRLITGGPYALMKHPLYTGMALLVLPWAGFVANTWLGAAAGVALYFGSRRFAPVEEAQLADSFDGAWDRYRQQVLFPWL